MHTRKTAQWVALEGNKPALSVHIHAEDVLENSAPFDINFLPLWDRNHFFVGQLHSCLSEWEYIIDQKANESS